MSIVQFLRILWAHRWLTALTTMATLIGALVAIAVMPASYQASARVMLNTLKPDPVTGELIGGRAAQVFIASQQRLIQDYPVATQAVDSLGWANNPEFVTAFNAARRPGRDIRRWLAERIMQRTKVNVLSGTNILEIQYTGQSPAQAAAMANALRDAYIVSTLNTRRVEAARNAAWYQQQADKERALLNAADEAKNRFETQAGIVMQDDKTDIETARLRALANLSPTAAPSAVPVQANSQSAVQLAELDVQISQAERTLGPNNPQMIELKARRASLAQMVSQEKAAATSVAASRVNRAELDRALSAQQSRVIANRDKIEHLTQLQAEVNLHRDQMEKALGKAFELRQQGAVADAGITVLNQATAPRSPSFPNKPLIVGGGLFIGAAIGLLLSLIIELTARRVRSLEDLTTSFDLPVLAVITPFGERRAKGGSLRAIIQRLTPRQRRISPA